MAKTTKMVEVAVSKLIPYEHNAKIHGQFQIEKLKDSIQEFGFLTPCLIDAEYRLVAGHGRVQAAKELGIEKVPCVFIEGLTETQRKAYILADNRLGDLGEWNMGCVNEELEGLMAESFDIELTGFDLPDTDDWFSSHERNDRSHQEGNEEYNEFLDKFEAPKTTDDCYTPDNIYNIIAEYVAAQYKKRKDAFIRPFYPGGDYTSENYTGKVVVDNPPFSILAEIIDYYLENGYPFFMFAPGLSALNYANREGVTAICTCVGVTYENGASVSTSFVTNLEGAEIAARADAELAAKIEQANKENEAAMRRSFPKYEYPLEVLTAAKMRYLAKYGQNLTIKREDAMFIRSLDAQKETGKGIFGGALLLSERAAAERAAAERAAATSWPLSEREQEIVKSLGHRKERDDG